MKPTMPMNAFPPGGPPPGAPPPGGTPPPGGGGWGPPPGGGPPSYGGGPPHGGPPSYGGFPQQQQPKKSKTGLYVGVGCGCLLLLGCLGAGGIFMAVSALGPGEEVSSVDVAPGTPFTLTYNQTGSQKYAAWLEVDVNHTASYNLTGQILLSEGGTPFGQYNLAEDGNGSPVTDRNDSVRINWVHTNSSTEGTTRLFPIPARTAGGSITVSGTVNAPPGTTGTIRIFVAKRD